MDAASYLCGMDFKLGDIVTFPSVVGLAFEEAQVIASASGVVLADFDPDAPPIGAVIWQRPHLVTEQSPTAGSTGRAWDSLRVRVKPLIKK